MEIKSPYINSSTYLWAKGNLHTHTTISDGVYDPQKTIQKYASMGYKFLMFSDHDIIGQIEDLEPYGMILISGNEITMDGPHILHVNAKKKIEPYPDRQQVLNKIAENGGFAIISHPNWEENFNHCSQEFLDKWKYYTGIEIYNGVVRLLPGNPCATDRWDRLLSQGKLIWGYADDDAHWEETYGVAWNVVQIETLTKENVLDALKRGNFYASTGVEIQKVSITQNSVSITTTNAKKISVIVNYGRRVYETKENSIHFKIDDDFPYTYFRFEFWGDGEEQAWTQPFLVINK